MKIYPYPDDLDIYIIINNRNITINYYNNEYNTILSLYNLIIDYNNINMYDLNKFYIDFENDKYLYELIKNKLFSISYRSDYIYISFYIYHTNSYNPFTFSLQANLSNNYFLCKTKLIELLNKISIVTLSEEKNTYKNDLLKYLETDNIESLIKLYNEIINDNKYSLLYENIISDKYKYKLFILMQEIANFKKIELIIY
jgi:hypothetical protein